MNSQEWQITFADGRQVIKRDKDLCDFLLYECPNPIELKRMEHRDRWSDKPWTSISIN